jgi:hypothetical protein
MPGRLIGTGRSADVYDAGNGRVLRRYRDGRPAAWVAREADEAMTWVIVAFSQVRLPRLEAVATRTMQAMFTRAFLRAAGPLDQHWRQAIVRYRLGDPHLLPAERPGWNAC